MKRRFCTALASLALLAGMVFAGPLVGAAPTKSGPLPDSTLTPGAVDARVTQENVGQTICVAGYGKSVRKVSSKKKKKVYAEYGISRKNRAKHVIDHLISLKLGGSNGIKNLWPEKKKGANGATTKNAVEDQLRTLVCNGTVPLATVQTAIAADWTTAVSAVTPTTTTTTAPPPPPPPTTAPPPPTPNCDPNYSGCVPIASDVDCAGGSGDGPAYTGPVRVIGADVYDLDADGDGFACE